MAIDTHDSGERGSLAREIAMCWEVNQDTGALFASTSLRDYVGWDLDQVVTFADLCGRIHAEDLEEFEIRIQGARASRDADGFDVRIRTHDGHWCWNRIWSQAFYGDDATLVGASMADISTLRDTQDALAVAFERLADISIFTGEIGFELDTQCRITWVSDQFSTFAGMPPSAARGQNVFGIFAELTDTEQAAWVERFLSSIDPTMQFEGVTHTRDKKRRWRHLMARKLINSQGELVGFRGVARDVTFRKRQELALMEAKQEAETANRAKSDFIAVMSHEIRTPLNALIGMTGLLAESALAEPELDFAKAAHSAGEHLLSLLNDVLDFSKLEAQKLELESEPVCLPALAREAMAMVRRSALTKGLELHDDIPADFPSHMQGDPSRLRQILLNLLGNAVKFTESGHVNLRLIFAPESATVRIEVSDSGIGISDDAMNALFSEFMQADVSITRRFGGTGLGLAITKRIVELMGGRIGAESQPEQGSLFWVELPFVPAMGFEQPLPDPATGDSDTLAPVPSMAILIVEDHPANQMLLRAILERQGHTCTLVDNGAMALDAVQSRHFDLLIMDSQMPVMNGEEAIRRIRALGGEYRRLPILALTADATRAAQSRLLASGADIFLTKPVRPSVLSHGLARAMARRASALLPPPPRDENEPLDRQIIDQFVEIAGIEALRPVVDLFWGSTEEAISNMRVLAAEGEFDKIGRSAHALKGAASSIGAAMIAQACHALERTNQQRFEAQLARLQDTVAKTRPVLEKLFAAS